MVWVEVQAVRRRGERGGGGGDRGEGEVAFGDQCT